MADQRDSLRNFSERVDAFKSLWQSLQFACLAVPVGPDWVQFAGRAELSTEPCDPNPTIRRLVSLMNLRAYSAKLKVDTINTLISNLADSSVAWGDPANTVLLTPRDARPYYWQQPYACVTSEGNASPPRWPTILRTYGSGSPSATLFPEGFWDNLDAQLRQHAPPFNGFAAICAKLGLEFDRSSSSPYFILSAQLPAKFISEKVDRQKLTLTLAIEYVGTPELVVEWLPVRETEKVPIPMRPIESVREREVTISIPSGATGVEAILLAMGLDADKMSCRVNWENTLLRIGEFFDTDQKRLGNLLFQEHSLRNVNPFELGLARLLGLAGFVVLWFGKAAKEALPDLIAYKRKPRGEELIIYAECTLKNPSEKFSDLAKRTEELRRFLGYEPGGILSVVFVRNEASAQDRRAASEFGLTLCDGSDIRKLHDRILSDASPGELVQFFRALNDPLAIQLRSTFP